MWVATCSTPPLAGRVRCATPVTPLQLLIINGLRKVPPLHPVTFCYIQLPLTTIIRTGTDVETLSNYKLPYWMRRGKHLRNEVLAAEWQVLRETCCKYRFGRVERNDGGNKKRPLPADNGADAHR